MKTRPCFKGAGRPVLVSCHSEYATSSDNLMIIIPLRQGFGSATYFDGEYKISHTIFVKEYDGFRARCTYDGFVQATDEVLKQHLESPLVDEEFRERALELIKECPLV